MAGITLSQWLQTNSTTKPTTTKTTTSSTNTKATTSQNTTAKTTPVQTASKSTQTNINAYGVPNTNPNLAKPTQQSSTPTVDTELERLKTQFGSETLAVRRLAADIAAGKVSGLSGNISDLQALQKQYGINEGAGKFLDQVNGNKSANSSGNTVAPINNASSNTAPINTNQPDLTYQPGMTRQDYINRYGYDDGTAKYNEQSKMYFASQNQVNSNTTANTTNTTNSDPNQSAYDYIDNTDLPSDIKALFKQIVGDYKETTIDTQKVLNAFNKLDSETISPYFKDLADTFKADIQNYQSQLNNNRALELEAQNLNATENINKAQEDLAARGAIYSGDAARLLGSKSAFTTNDPSRPLYQASLPEGLVNTQNRLIATGSENAYNANLRNLSRQAEDYLGTSAAKNLGFNSSMLSGTVNTGQLDYQKQQLLGNVLIGEANKEKQNISYDKSLNFF